MHHICIEVDDIHKAIQDVKDRVRPLSEQPKVYMQVITGMHLLLVMSQWMPCYSNIISVGSTTHQFMPSVPP